MESFAGLWIDHKKAVVVMIDNGETSLTVIPSHVERQFGRLDGIRVSTSYESLQFPADGGADRAFNHHLHVFYGRVITLIRESECIQIFGPGEAKIELAKQMEKVGLHDRILSLETEDKMTDPQITAKVRGTFLEMQPLPNEAVHTGS
jgi:hypothetical protein